MNNSVELFEVKKAFKLVHGRPSSLKSLALAFRLPKPEKLWALKGIDLSVEHGETLAVVGKNGSGKSTLLGLIGNIYRPTSGRIDVNGRVSALLELGAGFHPELTGLENIYLNGAILGIRTRDMKSKIDEIVDFSELHKFIDTPLKSYSKGMVMRLGFAVAVQVDPDILLIDEVLAVGDEAFQSKCYEKIAEFQQAGKTIIFVSHDLEAVGKVASRAVWIDGGLVRADGVAAQVLDDYRSSVKLEREGREDGAGD
jgi:lipopolysaccharide transport system ATP-binding protein